MRKDLKMRGKTQLTSRQLQLEGYLDRNRDRYISTKEISQAVEGYPKWQPSQYEAYTELYTVIMRDMHAVNDLGTKGLMITDGHYGFKFASSFEEVAYVKAKYAKRVAKMVKKYQALCNKLSMQDSYDLFLDGFVDLFESKEKEDEKNSVED